MIKRNKEKQRDIMIVRIKNEGNNNETKKRKKKEKKTKKKWLQ